MDADTAAWLRRMIAKKLIAGSVEQYDEARSQFLGDLEDARIKERDEGKGGFTATMGGPND